MCQARPAVAIVRAAWAHPASAPDLGGGGVWRRSLAATPDLLARVARLRPVRDIPEVDLERESRRDRRFSLLRLLREFRRPLLFGLLLVVIDGVMNLAGPVLVKTGIDNGVSVGSTDVLFIAAGVFLVVTLVDLVDEIGETFVTGRAAQRIMLSLRRLGPLSNWLEYLQREMTAGSPMTTDVDQFKSLIENGLLSALVSIVTFVGVGVALVLINTDLGLCTLSVAVPLAIATAIFRTKAARLYSLSRERIAIVNADFQESLSGVRESQAFVHEGATMAQFHRLGRAYLDTRVAAQRLVATYFPFVQFVSAVADAIVLGVGARLIASGGLTSGALIAFLLYIDLFFSPIQQLSQVFDAWQQTRVSVGRIAELMQLDTLTPEAVDPIDPGRLQGELTFTGVRFSYPSVRDRASFDGGRTAEPRGPADSRPLESRDATWRQPPEALREVNVQVGVGETVALVGETSAGKSTVMKLIARFYDPDEGSVRADRYDLRSVDLRSFRRQLGYVPQEAFLFSGTIRDNIAYGRPDAPDARVEAAARAVGAHDFIAQLAGGYHHELSESEDGRCHPASGSSLRWHARSSSILRCSCSTRRHQTSISRPRRTSHQQCGRCRTDGRRS